jgi:hypothetical protein
MKEIRDFPSYYASEDGKIYSGRFNKFKELKPFADRGGYLRVGLWRADGKRIKMAVARLILETFAGPPPSPCMQVRHLNDKRDDNRSNNLAWGTPTLNAREKKELVLFLGEKYPQILEEYVQQRMKKPAL